MVSWSLWRIFTAVVIGVTPGMLCTVWGRVLTRIPEDPAISERLHAHRRRVLLVTVTCGVTLAIVLPTTVYWSLPLLIVVRAVAAYPVRRSLYGETWNLGQYLRGAVRLYAAFLGFWILLGVSPVIIGNRPWPLRVAIAAILAAWNWWYPAVTLRLIGAKRFVPGQLESLFHGILTRSRAPQPLLWRAGPAGAVLANAVALPSIRCSSVLFSETLLERLAGEEVAAIFAHEVAHLEHFTHGYLLRSHMLTLVLILAGTLLVPAAQGAAAGVLLPLQLLWPVAVLFFLAVRMQASQRHETASDLRAVELCGDARALASALVKLNAISRMPRRWELELERSASHPSLARRLQTILGKPEIPSLPAADETQIFRTDESGVWLAFDGGGVTEFRDVPTGGLETRQALMAAAGQISTTRFTSIAELRVSAADIAAPQLNIVDRSGVRRRLRMRPEDLGRLQHTLDCVDALLPSPPKTLFAGRVTGSIAASVAAMCALAAGQVWSVVVVTLLAAFRPSVPMLLNAATASLLAVVLLLVRRTAVTCGRDATALLIGVLPLAAVALWLRLRLGQSGEGLTPKEPAWVLWVLGVSALAAAAAPAVLAQGSLLLFSEMSAMVIGATVLPFAAALLLITAGRRSLQLLGVISLLTAAVPVLATTGWFRDRIVRDPLLSAAPRVPAADLPMQQVGLFEVGHGATALRLSPLGTTIATRHGDPEDEDSYLSAFTVYRTGENSRTVQAVDFQFIDETSALVLTSQPDGATIRAVPLDGSTPLWEEKLENVQRGRIAISRTAARWRVVGETPERTLIRYEGALQGGDKPGRTSWQIPATTAPWSMRAVAGSGAAALWVQQEWQTAALGRVGTLVATIAGRYRVRSRLYLTYASGSRLLADSDTSVSCVDAAPGEDEPVCFATHRNITNVFGVDLRGGRLRMIGTIDGPVWPDPGSEATAIPLIWDSTPALLWTGSKPRLVRMSSVEERASFPAYAGTEVVGSITTTPTGCTVRVFQ